MAQAGALHPTLFVEGVRLCPRVDWVFGYLVNTGFVGTDFLRETLLIFEQHWRSLLGLISCFVVVLFRSGGALAITGVAVDVGATVDNDVGLFASLMGNVEAPTLA